MIKLNTSYVNSKINDDTIIKTYQNKVDNILSSIINKTAKGSAMHGWMTYTLNYDKSLIRSMLDKANSWRKSEIKNVVVIGIGGSCIGLKAAIDMIKLPFADNRFNLIYIENMNSDYMLSAINSLKNDKFAIVVISKSGTTLEPAIAFNLFKNKLSVNIAENELKNFIVAITDNKKGTLHDLAVKNDYTLFAVANDIGGRYSTLTPVGMFVMILMGLDHNQLITGANDAINDLKRNNLKENSAFLYACYRHYFYTVEHKQIENFIVYNPSLVAMTEQWKQLFSESEGKNHLAMYPVTSLFTTDLHSIGQFLQEGTRNFIETTLYINKPKIDLNLDIKNNEDELLFLNKKNISDINKIACESTILAHSIEGKVNNIMINLDQASEYNYGYLFIWLSHAAMMSGYLLDINPFDQPGVDAYKKRMFFTLRNK